MRSFSHYARLPHNRRLFALSGNAVVKPLPRLRLQGFNNLTKALSFNIFDVCFAASEDERLR